MEQKRSTIYNFVISWNIALGIPEIYLYIDIDVSLYNRPQIAGSWIIQRNKALGSFATRVESDIARNIRRFLEISRNGEEAKGWNRIEKGKWGCERSSPVRCPLWPLSRKRVHCTTGRQRSDLHIYSTRKISHRIDGKRFVVTLHPAG